MDCGGKLTLTCKGPPGKPLEWTISGLEGIDIMGSFQARHESLRHPTGRIATEDTGDGSQTKESIIIISRFNELDKGGIIQCVNADDGTTIGMATISMRECLCTIEVLN